MTRNSYREPAVHFICLRWQLAEKEDGCVLLLAVHSTHNSRNKDKCEFFRFLSNPKLFKKWEDLSRLVRGIALQRFSITTFAVGVRHSEGPP